MSTENSSIISVVTGGSGFVGSHLVDLLIEKGHKVNCPRIERFKMVGRQTC